MFADSRKSVSHAFRRGMAALVAVFLLLILAIASIGQSARAQTQVADGRAIATAARIAGDQDKSRFVLDLHRQVPYTVFVLADPFRVVIDMPEVVFDLPPDIGKQGRGLVAGYRYGRLGEGRSRIVLDMAGPVLIEKTFMVEPEAGGPARLVLDLIASDEKTYASIRDRLKQREAEAATSGSKNDPAVGAPPPASSRPDNGNRTGLPPTPRSRPNLPGGSLQTAGVAETPRMEPLPLDATALATKPANGGTLPIANAVVEPSAAFAGAGLATPHAKPKTQEPRKAKPVVVIDPGHGGVDPGAISASGTLEKHVVLGFAKSLRDALAATGRYDVRLTRSDDRFITLGKRVAFARANHADLFISIHADSLKTGVAHGATVYTLSEQASDKEAAEIAAAENKADLVGGVLEETDSNELTDILVDLVHLETKHHSMYFANTLVRSLDGATRLNTKPQRNAGFRVLRAPDVPSVLLELGYLSSREDEQRMTSDAWRKKVSGAMVSAVDRFFGTEIARRQ